VSAPEWARPPSPLCVLSPPIAQAAPNACAWFAFHVCTLSLAVLKDACFEGMQGLVHGLQSSGFFIIVYSLGLLALRTCPRRAEVGTRGRGGR